jgi:enamine deaminase RidA (YjgF/YER057c/UK114 family)
MNEREITAGLAPTPGYRYADRVGDHLHLAGQVPLDAAGVLVGAGDVQAQVRQCAKNLFAIVEAHRFGREDIHQLTVYVVGEQHVLQDAWVAVVECFDGNVPPATLLGVNLLGYTGQLVELDAHVSR